MHYQYIRGQHSRKLHSSDYIVAYSPAGRKYFMNDLFALDRAIKCIPYPEFVDIATAIKSNYSFSSPTFWMWKAFQFGFIHGKRAERARKKAADR